MIEYTDHDQAMSCPFCGVAVTTPPAGIVDEGDPSSAKTVVHASKFKNSAEILDEVKRLIGEGDTDGAIKVYAKEFGVPKADARTSVEQIEIDMRPKEETPPPVEESAPPPPPPPPPHSPIPDPAAIRGEVVDSASQKPSTARNWIIGCGVAFLLFCCLCVILPTIVYFVMNQMGGTGTP